MTDKAAIQGTFSDLKSVKTRSVIQMVVEIPIEQAEQVIKAFGFPQPGAEIMVAVARLDPEKVKPAPAPLKTAAKLPFKDRLPSVQAGIRCSDPQFQDFLAHRYENMWMAIVSELNGESRKDIAADLVRDLCDVGTRRTFDVDDTAEKAWRNLNSDFQEWAGYLPEQR